MKIFNSSLSVILGFIMVSSANAAATKDTNANIDSSARFEFSAGAITVYFTDCKGMGSQNELVQARTGPRGEIITAKVPGPLSVKNITCSKILGKSLDLWNWRQQIADRNIARARFDATLIAYDETLTPIAEWNFAQVWPISIDYNETNPGKETVVFAAEHIQRTK
ncbi:phage tail protein (plasmid) [Methylomonas sp. 2BW1-5-20]|uniref:phage tail protein n=1 Tax=Methylomonas sp. 2BW1-5-20 TaxID=3376686 RepID=UPI004051A25A